MELLFELGIAAPAPSELAKEGSRWQTTLPARMDAWGVSYEGLEVYSTPRRLAFRVRGVSGEPTPANLSAHLSHLVQELPVEPKWMVALLEETVLPLEVGGVRADNQTQRHPVLGKGDSVSISHPSLYMATLKQARVIPDLEGRRTRLMSALKELLGQQGLDMQRPPEWSLEAAQRVEWPQALVGGFAEGHLKLPHPLVALALQSQGVVELYRTDGRLANRFLVVDDRTPAAQLATRIEAEVERCLAMLQQVWQEDRQLSLTKHLAELHTIPISPFLGTLQDKAERVRRSSLRIGERIGADRDLLREAAALSYADQATQTVTLFPRAQGLVARLLAQAENQPQGIAEALEDSFKPNPHQHELPRQREGLALALAHKTDSLIGYQATLVKEAAQSAATGHPARTNPVDITRELVHLLAAMPHDLSLKGLLEAAREGFDGSPVDVSQEVLHQVEQAIWTQLEHILVAHGLGSLPKVPHQRTVAATVRTVQLVAALGQTPQFEVFMGLLRPLYRLTQMESTRAVVPRQLGNPEEVSLNEALPGIAAGVQKILALAEKLPSWDLIGPKPQVDWRDYAESMTEVLAFREPFLRIVDRMAVLDDNLEAQSNRLALLHELRRSLGVLGQLH
jgi:glycyl-tRNA synthetase beta subunit